MMNAPGRTYLKVVGILLIIGGAIGTVMGLLIIAGGAVGSTLSMQGTDEAALAGVVVSGIFVAMGIVAVICAVFNLICGIVGVKNCDKPEAGAKCFKFGIAMIVLTALNVIFTMVGSQITASSIVSSLFSFVLPVLYTIGAKKNKDAMQAPVQ